MLNSRVAWFIALLCCVATVSKVQQAQAQQANPNAQAGERNRAVALKPIIPGHDMFSSGTLNSGIIATDEGVVVLDARETEAVAKAEREVIATTIKQPVRYLVSSTHHNNYSKGNIAYADV